MPRQRPSLSPSTQSDQRPDRVDETPAPSLETGELGSEGGSYGDLIQAKRPPTWGGASSGLGANPLIWAAIVLFVLMLGWWLVAGL